MVANRKGSNPRFLLAECLPLTMLCATLIFAPRNVYSRNTEVNTGSAPSRRLHLPNLQTRNDESPERNTTFIPVGTILPVRLNKTISSNKNRPGEEVTGRIMQDVPLGEGKKIRKGSKVAGHIVEIDPEPAGQGTRVTLQFDKVIVGHQEITIATSLRAIAGFMSVLEAQTPPIGPSESDVYDWLTTAQIGGDVVYGKGGIVTSADNSDQIVGREVYGGVLGRVMAKEGSMCRGAINGNDQPQAFWVFSTSACGTYGLGHTTIAHAGRTDPKGMIVLVSDRGPLKIVAGAGMLLRVNDVDK